MAKKTYITPAGESVPAQFVPAYDKLRDQIAQRIAKRWQDGQERLQKIKAETVADIDKLIDAAAKEAHVNLGGDKGNCQFRSFDGTITIGRDRQYRTEFDERLQFAQQLIFEAVDEIKARVQKLFDELGDKAKGELDNIQNLMKIASRAFQPRKNGNLDMQRIRDLRTYNVNHPKWKQACEIISECERTIGHRDYIRVAVRKTSDAKPTPIVLDIANL